MALLELHHASRSYGGIRVVDDLSLSVDPGEVLGIVGPNGAGKTTALSMIGGEVALSAGEVRFDGRDITGLSADRRCRLGIARTFQVPLPFAKMTVLENVIVGALHGGRSSGVRATDAALETLARTDLTHRANALAGSLTLLERKRLELARGLVTEPRVMLLDESAGGLTEPEVERLLPTIQALRSSGVAVIWIEHVVHALLAVADRLLCIAHGKALIEGDPRDVMRSAAVEEIYLGTMDA